MQQPKSQVPAYDILLGEQLELIHQKTLHILQEGGIAFLYEPAVAILRAHGVDVDDDGVARFSPDIIESYLAKTPSQFTWSAPNPQNDVDIGGDHVCFAPVVGPPFVVDSERGRRESTHQDLINFLKLTQSSPYLHCSGSEIVVSSDLPIASRHLELFYSHFEYSDKAMMGVYHTGLTGEDSLAMARIFHGEDAMANKHFLHCIVNVSSPRRLDDRMLSLLIAYAKANQIVNITPFILSGAMGPTSILGTVAQLNAETLAGIVFTQMVRAGTPCIYGSFQSVVDLQSGAPVLGAPESQLALYISGQLARRYGIPFRAAGHYASSKIIDAQGAYESALSMGPSLLSAPNFVLHAAGWLESGLAAGYEKFVLDSELLGMYHTFFKGINWDEDEWAMESILHEVPPGGHHLGTAHTMRHFRDAFYRAELFDYDAAETWAAKGAEDAVQRANRKYKQMIADYQKPPVDEGRLAALRGYIEERKQHLTPAMIVG